MPLFAVANQRKNIGYIFHIKAQFRKAVTHRAILTYIGTPVYNMLLVYCKPTQL